VSWTFDAPTGTYRNFALSSEIRRQAIADVQFMKFMRAEQGYGKKRGESVTITRIMKLPLATRVNEIDRLPSGRPAIETKTVTTSQWGFKIPMTEFETHLTHFNLMDPFQQALRDQISLTMDKMCADALRLTPVVYTPLSTGGEFVTTGTAVSLSNRNLEVQDLRRIHDRLHGDLKCPKFKNGKYVAILSTRAARGLKNDPEYKDWLAFHTDQPLLTGQLMSNIEGFSIFETNNTDSLSDLIGNSVTTGEAMFFGADAGGLVRIMDPEIRAGIPEELGTFREVGWVGTTEAFLTWERPSLARVIRLGST
jgi:N4-gp56 family major capsid protein